MKFLCTMRNNLCVFPREDHYFYAFFADTTDAHAIARVKTLVFIPLRIIIHSPICQCTIYNGTLVKTKIR